MDIHRTNVWRPLGRLRAELDRQFADWFENVPLVRSTGRFPAVNVWEADDQLHVEAELPGVEPADLEISIVDKQLTLKGVRQEKRSEAALSHRSERTVGAFSRVIDLPFEVDADRVQAKLTDGVLLVTLPKHETAKPRKIQVTTAPVTEAPPAAE